LAGRIGNPRYSGATQSFNLATPAGTLAYFDFLLANQSNLRVRLSAPDVSAVFDMNTGGVAPFVLAQSETCTLIVSNRSTAVNVDFAFQVLGTPAAALTFDAPVSGTLEHAGAGRQARWYQFNARAGESFFGLNQTGAASDGWRVFDGSVAQIVTAPPNQNLSATIPADGEYLLLLMHTASRQRLGLRWVRVGGTHRFPIWFRARCSRISPKAVSASFPCSHRSPGPGGESVGSWRGRA